MKLNSANKVDTNLYELKIEVDGAALDTAIGNVYRKQAKKFNIPGFRKGKATRGMIEKFYGAEVFYEDALNDILPGVMNDAIEEAKLDVVSYSYDDMEMGEISKDGFSFDIKVTVKPEVEVGEYKGIEVEKPPVEVTEDDIKEELEKLQERNSRLVTVEDRAAQDGDTAIIDFEGFVDGVAFEGGKGEDHTLQLGSGQFIPGFEEQVVSHKAGEEFDITVTFPEDYSAAELAGQEAVFKIKLKELKFRELPELDDEFAKDVSEFDTLAEYKEDISKNITERKETEADKEVDQKLSEKLIEDLQGEIPDVMFERRMDDDVREFGSRLQSQGLDLETYLQYIGQDMDTFRAGFRPQAENQVKLRLALEKIAALEDIQVSEEDLQAEYEKIASAYNMEADQIKGFIRDEDLEKDIAAEKAMTLVKDNAKIK